jgi:hypothetical protein
MALSASRISSSKQSRGSGLLAANAWSIRPRSPWPLPSRTISIDSFIAAGVFAELDLATRRSGELIGFDADGRATIDPAIGGKSTELWTGLFVRAQWRGLFADLGYALFTRRWDTGRDDLPSADGTTDGAFSTEPAVRWMFALGGAVPLRHDLAITIRLEWRIRYYDERGGQSLRDGIVHGTQEIRPLFGVTWRPCW